MAEQTCCLCCCQPKLHWLRYRNSEAFLAKYRGALEAYGQKHGIRKSEQAVFRKIIPRPCGCTSYRAIDAVAPTAVPQIMDRGDGPPPLAVDEGEGSELQVGGGEEEPSRASKMYQEDRAYSPQPIEEETEPTSEETTSHKEDSIIAAVGVEGSFDEVEVSFDEDNDGYNGGSNYRQRAPRMFNDSVSPPRQDYNAHENEIARLKERTSQMRERRAKMREEQQMREEQRQHAVDPPSVGNGWGLFSY